MSIQVSLMLDVSVSGLESGMREGVNMLVVFSEDLLYFVLRGLDSRELRCAALVSKRFCQLVGNPYIWRYLCETVFGFNHSLVVDKSFDWKLYYREKSAILQPLNWVSLDNCGGDLKPLPRQCHGAAAVGNKIIIMGGHQFQTESYTRYSDIWCFDTDLLEFSLLEPKALSPIPQLSRNRLVTINNIIYSFGGILQSKQKLNTVFKLDLQELTWEALQISGTVPDPRCDAVVVSYQEKIIVYGGSVSDLIFPSDLHVLDTKHKIWQKINSSNSPSERIGSNGVVIEDKFYLYGGGLYSKEQRKFLNYYKEVWCLDLKTYEWTLLHQIQTDIGPSITDFFNCVAIGNHIFFEGGWYSGVYVFDVIKKEWKKLEHDGPKINNHESSASLIGDAIYYYGGFHNEYRHHLRKLPLSHLHFLFN